MGIITTYDNGRCNKLRYHDDEYNKIYGKNNETAFIYYKNSLSYEPPFPKIYESQVYRNEFYSPVLDYMVLTSPFYSTQVTYVKNYIDFKFINAKYNGNDIVSYVGGEISLTLPTSSVQGHSVPTITRPAYPAYYAYWNLYGRSEYLDILPSFLNENNFTICAWVKKQTKQNFTGNNTRFLFNINLSNSEESKLLYWDTYYDYSMGSTSDGVNYTNINSDFTHNKILDGYDWHHVTLVKNGNTLSLYEDVSTQFWHWDTSGTKVYWSAVCDITGYNFTKFTIGCSTANDNWYGSIKNLHIFSEALTQEQILYMYNNH